jgi:hypothetical protein
MSTKSATQGVQSILFDSIRNISCAHDLKNDRKVLMGRARASQVLGLNTDENVRAYLVDAEGKKKKRKGEVHRKIEDTIENYPENFCVLNGGIVIVARDYEVNEKAKSLELLRPSIINGAQTQGVLKDCSPAGQSDLDVFVTFELIVTKDEALIADISIARNFQNDVQNISIAGSKGVLEDLEAALQSSDAKLKLRKSETDRSVDYTDTEKLIQVLMALTPSELFEGTKIGNRDSKAYTYSQKATCLKDFSNVYEAQKLETLAGPNRKLYRFFLDISVEALALYERWKSHQGFQGSALRSIERDGRQVVEVPDGIIFPIIASLSVFAKKTGNIWKIEQPKELGDSELVSAAKVAYMQIAGSNPQTMGKKSACYSSLLQLTSVYKKLIK